MVDERAPTRFVDGGRATLWDGSVHRFGVIGSTMVEARRLAAAGARHGTVAVAVEQTAGHGRSGRQWASPAGNLHATLVLRPGCDARLAPQVGFVVAVAVADAVDQLAGAGTALKWPNDVMRGGAKLAGLLMERTEDGAVLAGVGVNVRHRPSGVPYAVTSLHALGCPADASDMLAAIAGAVQAEWAGWCADGFSQVLRRWAARGPAPGTGLVVRVGEHSVAGRFAGLRADGALLLDTPAGLRAMVAGDVQPCAGLPEGATTAPC